MNFQHGGDIYTHQGCLDFSASINPIGMPKQVAEALSAKVDAYAVYPDPHCRAAVDAFSEHLAVDPSWVVCTAGATDLMSRVCRALKPRRALVAAPCYSGYQQALEQVGAEVVAYKTSIDHGFQLDSSFLNCVDADVDLVVIASPNNPTGLLVDSELMEAIVCKARSANAFVLVDECFLELSSGASAIPLCGDNPHVIVMRALTKSHALAGVRVGCGVCSDGSIVQALEEAGQPWSVSVPAQLAAGVAFDDKSYLALSRQLVATERAWLTQALESFGYRVIPGQANFLLFQAAAPDLFEPLLAEGILIRRCDNFVGLDSTWYRVAVRTRDENQQLVDALERIEGKVR